MSNNIPDLRRAVLLEAVRQALSLVTNTPAGEYLRALAEKDLAETENATSEATDLNWQFRRECSWLNCCRTCEQGRRFCSEHDPDPQPVVEVELVAKQPVPPIFADVVMAKPADTPPVTGNPVSANGHAAKLAPDLSDEEAAREWIIARAQSASTRREDAPRIDIAELMEFTGWGRSRCQQFISITLDELKMKPAAPKGGISALIDAINGPDDEELDEIEAAPFPASAENAKGSELPPYITRAGCQSMTEHYAMMSAKGRAKTAGVDFNPAEWLQKYRSKKAAVV